jgi:hypothetical protein
MLKNGALKATLPISSVPNSKMPVAWKRPDGVYLPLSALDKLKANVAFDKASSSVAIGSPVQKATGYATPKQLK